jgi:hypothetical protein
LHKWYLFSRPKITLPKSAVEEDAVCKSYCTAKVLVSFNECVAINVTNVKLEYAGRTYVS